MEAGRDCGEKKQEKVVVLISYLDKASIGRDGGSRVVVKREARGRESRADGQSNGSKHGGGFDAGEAV